MAGVAVVSVRRLERFARERGLLFDEAPAVRRSPAAFRQYERQKPVGWFGVPGATGFEVAQRIEDVPLDEENGLRSRRTWAAFALRPDAAGSARDAVARILPAGWHVETVGDELVLWTTRRERLISPRLWSWLERAQSALAPRLGRPAATTELAARQRRGIRRTIEK